MRAFSKYRQLLKENSELKEEIKKLDSKLNEAFKYLLDKIEGMQHKRSEAEPIGYKIKKV